jgi:hypothetical protein
MLIKYQYIPAGGNQYAKKIGSDGNRIQCDHSKKRSIADPGRRRCANCGLYSVPGGRCGPKESPADCAIREALEEAGVVVEICQEIGNFFTMVRGNCFYGHVYESRIVSGIPSPGSGIRAVCWAHLDVIEELEKRNLMIEGKLLKVVKGCLKSLS